MHSVHRLEDALNSRKDSNMKDFGITVCQSMLFRAPKSSVTLHSYIFFTFKTCFRFRLKSNSSPCFPRGRSLNLLCVLSVPRHSLATLRIPPQLTCVCVCDSCFTEPNDLQCSPPRLAEQRVTFIFSFSFHGVVNVMHFRPRTPGFRNLGHYFALSVLSF